MNPYFEQHKLPPISQQNLKQYFYQAVYSGFGVGLCAALKTPFQSRLIPEVKLLECCRAGYAAQTRRFPIHITLANGKLIILLHYPGDSELKAGQNTVSTPESAEKAVLLSP